MKKFLQKLLAKRRAELKETQIRFDACTDINEVRALGDTLSALKTEIEDIENQLADLENGGYNGNDDDGAGDGTNTNSNDPDNNEGRSGVPANAILRNGVVLGSFGSNVTEPENNIAYRTAFMDFVLRGTPIPAELRANENTLTTDVQSAIPTELVNQIIEKFDNVGMILPLINRTSYAAGVEIPVSTLKPVATWVAEGKTSDRQKKTTGKISFTYFKLRCEISMSMEVGTMALAAFETKFVENVTKAMVKAIEQAVINGTGEGQPKGILAAEVPEGQTITGTLSFAKLAEVEGAIPEEYETGAKWCMSKKTFAKIQGLSDADGHPIARLNYGIGGALERTILGREVVVTPYVAENKTFVFDFSDYTLNTIYDMGISKKQDWDTEDHLIKAVMSCDGKVVDNGSLVTFNFEDLVNV